MSSTAIFFATERSILLKNLFVLSINVLSVAFKTVFSFVYNIKMLQEVKISGTPS